MKSVAGASVFLILYDLQTTTFLIYFWPIIFIPSKYIKTTLIFWCFQGVQSGKIVQK